MLKAVTNVIFIWCESKGLDIWNSHLTLLKQKCNFLAQTMILKNKILSRNVNTVIFGKTELNRPNTKLYIFTHLYIL